MHSQNVKHALDTLADGQGNGLADRAVLAGIADHFGWAATVQGKLDMFNLSNGLHVALTWTGDVLTYAERGTRVSAVMVQADRYSAAEMVQLAAMFLSDTE